MRGIIHNKFPITAKMAFEQMDNDQNTAFLDNHFYTLTKQLYSNVNVLGLQSRRWPHCNPLPYVVKESGVAVVGQNMLV